MLPTYSAAAVAPVRGLIVTFAAQSSLDPRALIARKVNTLGAISRGLFARSLLRIPCVL